jgi:hypothetical protein
MLRKALPEGVLRPDGNMMGFLYFDRPQQVTTATLIFDVVNALDDERAGTIRDSVCCGRGLMPGTARFPGGAY